MSEVLQSESLAGQEVERVKSVAGRKYNTVFGVVATKYRSSMTVELRMYNHYMGYVVSYLGGWLVTDGTFYKSFESAMVHQVGRVLERAGVEIGKWDAE